VKRLTRRKRFPLEIIVDILRAASGSGVTITALEHKSDTNFLRASRYAELLISRNLLKCVGSDPRLYRTTARGEQAANVLADAEEIVFGKSNPPLTPIVFHERTGTAPHVRNVPNLSKVRKSFAELSRICKLRNGYQCILGGRECKLEDCLLFGTKGQVQFPDASGN
jgi:predicted transcriptional regulator